MEQETLITADLKDGSIRVVRVVGNYTYSSAYNLIVDLDGRDNIYSIQVTSN